MSNIEMWERLHSGAYETELEPLLQNSWSRCFVKKINPYMESVAVMDDARFQKCKEESYPTYVSGNRILTAAASCLNNSNIGLVLFSKEACLLKLYGSDHFMKWATQKGFVPGSDWSEASIGASAVSLGLRYEQTFATHGEQHFARLLTDTAICFAPCRIDRPLAGGAYPFRANGIAVVGLNEVVGDCALALAYSIAEAVSLRGFFTKAEPVIGYQRLLQQGVLAIDFENGRKRIIRVDSNMCEFWSMSYADLYYKDLNRIVKNDQDNKVFWDVINNQKEVIDFPVTIKVGNTKKKYFLTSKAYYETIMDFSGILLNLRPATSIIPKASAKKSLIAECTFETIIGNSINTEKTKSMARSIAESSSNVLLLGESGTGKDLYAQAIHNGSKRRNGPFVAVNCAAFPKDLFVSELFGYEQGAYTGAKGEGNVGKFEIADGGALFLDEVGDMPLECQAILLRALEQKTFMRLGSSVQRQADVRIIAATNADLREKIKRKEFREDLYYRLAVMCLWIPPLRERKDDIQPLADYFMYNYANEVGKNGMVLARETIDNLNTLSWKGNVRELKHLIESVVQFYSTDIIYPEHIVEVIKMKSDLFYTDDATLAVDAVPVIYSHHAELSRQKNNISVDLLKQSLQDNRYNKSKTAADLGISRKTLYRLMEKYGIS